MTGAHRFGIETLREAARKGVAESSLRDVAGQVPMSFSGLRSFLAGGQPQAETLAKLVAWYAERFPRVGGRSVARSDLEAALELIEHYLNEPQRSDIRDRRAREIRRRLFGERSNVEDA